MNKELEKLKQELERYKQWVADCQSGMYINCVYCGHRYGPSDEVPCSKADALKQHIAQCDKHPMSKLLKLCKDVSKSLANEIVANEFWATEAHSPAAPLFADINKNLQKLIDKINKEIKDAEAI